MKNYLGIGVFFKNDHYYMREWIEFHKLIGVERFYMACNDDDPAESLAILKPYMDEGIMDFHVIPPQPGVVGQMKAHDWFIKEAVTKWLIVIDMDEFMFRPLGGTMQEILVDYEQYGALAPNWLNYGSSGLYMPPALQTESFVYRAPDHFKFNYMVKSIIQPERTVSPINPHTFKHKRGFPAVDEMGRRVPQGLCVNVSPPLSHRRVRINHYRVRSWLDYKKKTVRWGKDGGHPEFLNNFDDYFTENDTNEVYDPAVHVYLPALKDAMSRYKGK